MADTRGEASSSERPQLVTVCRSVGAPRRSPGTGIELVRALGGALGADLGQVGWSSVGQGRPRCSRSCCWPCFLAQDLRSKRTRACRYLPQSWPATRHAAGSLVPQAP